MPNNSCNKIYYFVHLDSKMHPIPSTMFGKSTAASNPCTTLIAPLTGETMTAPQGEVQCFPENGFRYWYQVKSVPTGGGNQRREIVPNSMIEIKGVPKKGPLGKACDYVEYKIFKPL